MTFMTIRATSFFIIWLFYVPAGQGLKVFPTLQSLFKVAAGTDVQYTVQFDPGEPPHGYLVAKIDKNSGTENEPACENGGGTMPNFTYFCTFNDVGEFLVRVTDGPKFVIYAESPVLSVFAFSGSGPTGTTTSSDPATSTSASPTSAVASKVTSLNQPGTSVQGNSPTTTQSTGISAPTVGIETSPSSTGVSTSGNQGTITSQNPSSTTVNPASSHDSSASNLNPSSSRTSPGSPASPSTSSTPSDVSGMSKKRRARSSTIGGIFGGLAALLMIIGCIVCWRRKIRRHKQTSPEPEGAIHPFLPDDVALPLGRTNELKVPLGDIPEKQFSDQENSDQLPEVTEDRPISIASLSAHSREEGQTQGDLRREIEILRENLREMAQIGGGPPSIHNAHEAPPDYVSVAE